MKLTRGLAMVALLATGATAQAVDLSATITGVTDYDFRGITQSAQNPALQGSVDVATDAGFYAGVWGSNVDFGSGDPNVEVDWYAGWGGGEDLTWDLGITYYTYINSGSSNYPEAHLGFGYKWVDVKAWYSWDYAGIDGASEHYYETNVNYPLPANFGLAGHIGYSNGNGIKDTTGQGSYMDWSVGVTYTWSHFDMSLKWVDGSDARYLDPPYEYKGNCDCFKQTDVFSSEARAIFQISTTFPWKKEGEE
ncbi:MAG: TorF family putative porin [Steroidobacteraceae bacterium]